MDFSFDHSQIPIIGLKALELPASEAASNREAALAKADKEKGKSATADSTNSTLEKRLENASLSPGVSLNEHTLGAWRRSGISQVSAFLSL